MNDVKAPLVDDPVAFLLLSLPDVTVTQKYEDDEMQLAHGQFSLECVSLPIPPEIGHQTANPFAPSGEETHDLWLVIKVGDFEQTLVPGNRLGVRAPPGGDGGPKYIITHPDIPNAQVTIAMEAPRSTTEMEDLVNFESLLTQYGAINPTDTALTGIIAPVLIHPPTEDSIAAVSVNEENKLPSTYNETMLAPPIVQGGADLRGKIVLIDESSGAVLGELEEAPAATQAEAAALASSDPTRPVVVDFGALVNSYVGHNVTVTTVPQDELNDPIFRGADKLSRTILAFGSWGSQAMLTGAEKFTKHTVPCPEPIKVGAKTQANLKTAHSVSFKSAQVSNKTVNTINNVIGRITGGKAASIKTRPSPPPQSPAAAAAAAASAPNWGSSSGTSRTGGYTDMLKQGAEKLKVVAGYAGYGSRPTSPGGSGATTPTGTSAPALPPRRTSPGPNDPPAYTAQKSDSLYPTDKASASSPLTPSGPGAPVVGSTNVGVVIPPHPLAPAPVASSSAPRKRGLVNRTVVALDAVMSAAEVAANNLMAAGTAAASTAVAHRYGTDAGHATALAGSTVRNVALVYVDARGVARRGILKATAKGYVKARLRGGETVRIQPQAAGATQGPAIIDHQLVVNVPQAPAAKK